MRQILAVVLVLAACGTDSLSIDDYPDAVQDSYCNYLVRCGDVENLATCRAANTGFSFHLSASLLAAIDKTTIKFEGGNARTCLDALARRSCDATSESSRAVPQECFHVATGSLHAGATCGIDAECISQLCDVPFCDSACCMGTCSGDGAPAPVALGGSCQLANCDDTSFCDLDTLLCVALQPSGGACASLEQCDYGLDCLPTGRCGALPAPGAPCSGACRDVGTTCSAAGICVKVALAGAACTTSQDCSPIYGCDTTGHCSPGVATGAACDFGSECADDQAFCDIPADQDTGVCALPKADGAACQRDANCESRYCDGVGLVCAPEPICI